MSRFTVQHVRASVLYAIATMHDDRFAWPDDGCACLPWAYEIHCGWVADWNGAERQTPCVEFLTGWLQDDANILAALERMEARDRLNEASEVEWRRANPEKAAEYDAAVAKARKCPGCGKAVPDIMETGAYCARCVTTLSRRGPCFCGIIGVMEPEREFEDATHIVHSHRDCRPRSACS